MCRVGYDVLAAACGAIGAEHGDEVQGHQAIHGILGSSTALNAIWWQYMKKDEST